MRLRRWTMLVLLILSVWAPAAVRAQPAGTAIALQEASYKAGLGRWVEAIEQYQRILETAGDDLVPLPAPVVPLGQLVGGPAFTIPWQSSRSLPARWLVHEQLGRLPPAALKLYRDRVDASAAKRFEEARGRADNRALEQILADCFNGRAGEDAILLLAQRAFERADFAVAARYWRMLLSGRDNERRYPDPRTPQATTQARLILAQLFRGDFGRARRAVTAFRSAYPEASGLLAGREGNFAGTLEALLKDPRLVTLPAPPGDGREWSTFACRPSRDSAIATGLPRYWPGPPTWQATLPAGRAMRVRDDPPPDPDRPRALAFHPVIAQGRAFVADAVRVFAFDLVSGKRTTVFALRKDGRLPGRPEQRYTLTYADSFLYVRLGAQPPHPRGDDDPDAPSETAGAIVCLGPIPDTKDASIPHAWTLRPPKTEKEATTVFEGTPLVHDGKIYTVLWRQAGGAVTTAVACYQSQGAAGPPELLWQREAGRPGFNPASETRARHDLLTLAGPNVVLCTNAGNVLALEIRTGKPAWEYRYGRNERRPAPVGRDLCPCLFDGQRIFAAPADSDRLLCLDATTGRLLWDIEGVDVVHLLGVARGRLIATFAGPVKGIRGINVESGAESAPDGWTQHDGGGEATFGRGFVTPDLIFWPTAHGLQFLRPEDGSPARQPVPGRFGNLAYADRCFIVTNATEVQGYVSEGKLLNERRHDVEKQPASKLLLWKLGRAEADSGLVERALEHFDDVARQQVEPALARRALDQAKLLRWEPSAERKFNAWFEDWWRSRAQGAAAIQVLVRAGKEPSLLRIEPSTIETGRFAAPPREAPPERPLTGEGPGPLKVAWRWERSQPQRLPLPPLGDAGAKTIWLYGPDGLTGVDAMRVRRYGSLPPSADYRVCFRQGERDVFVGERFLAAYRADADKPDWSIHLADAGSAFGADEPLPLRDPTGFWNGQLSAFHRCGRMLYALLDGRALLAFDVETGSLRWCHWAISATSLAGPTAVCIRPFFHAGERHLLLQLSSGRLRIVDASDGRTRLELPTPQLAWPADPVAIDEQHVVFSEDAGAIVCLNLETGRPRWRYVIRGPSSLVGNAPRLRHCNGLLLIGLERNFGMELDAINPGAGRSAWAKPLFLGRNTIALTDADADGQYLYVMTAKGIQAIETAWGKQSSLFPLPGESGPDWRVLCGKGHLFVFPKRPLRNGAIDLEREFSKIVVYLPTFPRLGRVLGKSYHVWKDRTLPLLVLAKEDGRLVQRLAFPAQGLAGEVRRASNGIAVVTGAGAWGLEEKP